MGVIQITEELLNKAFTENGDTAYRTSLSHCLDYFSLAGALRGKYPLVTSLFLKAYHEDPQKAVKLLKELKEIGLIECERIGLTKPNRIYVKTYY